MKSGYIRQQDLILTKSYDNLPDKIKAIQEQAPDIYEKIINIGKNKHLFRIYKKIKKYLN